MEEVLRRWLKKGGGLVSRPGRPGALPPEVVLEGEELGDLAEAAVVGEPLGERGPRVRLERVALPRRERGVGDRGPKAVRARLPGPQRRRVLDGQGEGQTRDVARRGRARGRQRRLEIARRRREALV